jgi:hypothetical protein
MSQSKATISPTRAMIWSIRNPDAIDIAAVGLKGAWSMVM